MIVVFCACCSSLFSSLPTIIVKPTINFTLARLGNLASERVCSRNCCSLKCKHIFGFYYKSFREWRIRHSLELSYSSYYWNTLNAVGLLTGTAKRAVENRRASGSYGIHLGCCFSCFGSLASVSKDANLLSLMVYSRCSLLSLLGECGGLHVVSQNLPRRLLMASQRAQMIVEAHAGLERGNVKSHFSGVPNGIPKLRAELAAEANVGERTIARAKEVSRLD